MSDINTVNLLNQIQSMAAKAEGFSAESGTNGISFNNVLVDALNQVNDLNQNESALKSRYEMGDSNVSLGEVMIATQKSSLGLQATVQVRNKLVNAYNDVMNMPL